MNRALKLFVNGPIWNFLLIRIFLPNIFKLADTDYFPEEILELGCGIGTSTRQIAKRFPEAQITATDYDPIQVGIAGKRLKSFKNITVAQADATNLSFADNSFDAVFIFNSLHHINPYEKAIAEITRVLKTEGLVYIMDEGVKFFNPIFKWIDQPESVFEKSDIIKEAEKNDLQLIKQSGTERLFYLVFKKNKQENIMPKHYHSNFIEELGSEHQNILSHLADLEAAIVQPAISRVKVEEFLRFTETFAEPHHQKEEQVLFPALEKKGMPHENGPIGMMLLEHAAKRDYLIKIKEALKENNEDKLKENAQAMISLLKDHIYKEDNILYPCACDMLSEEELESLGLQFKNLHIN